MYRSSYNRRQSYSGRYNNRQNIKKINENKFVKKAGFISGADNFIPRFEFKDLPINQTLKDNIIRKKYDKPTAIQDGVINHIMAGKDVIGIANTGTGKTAAFLIPLIEKVYRNPREKVLIITPTRELALQIRDEIRAFSQSMGIYSTLCIGGAFIRNQISELRRNPQFVIGTPGRLKDLIEKRVINTLNFNNLVLDEVDRMLDMGFIKDVRFLISQLPRTRQTLFFSATISQEIENIIQTFLKDPIKVSVKAQDTAENVEQDVIRLFPGANKLDILEKLLKKEDFKKVLIFTRTKYGAENLSTMLYRKGFKVTSIHGDKPQNRRNQAMLDFKSDYVSILVATDVAARGLDIMDISHVINFDQPATYDDYIHRIGRTGRANKKGIALTFV